MNCFLASMSESTESFFTAFISQYSQIVSWYFIENQASETSCQNVTQSIHEIYYSINWGNHDLSKALKNGRGFQSTSLEFPTIRFNKTFCLQLHGTYTGRKIECSARKYFRKEQNHSERQKRKLKSMWTGENSKNPLAYRNNEPEYQLEKSFADEILHGKIWNRLFWIKYNFSEILFCHP